MLELAARMVAEEPTALPERFLAFGAEEPRAPGDDRHHYGSRRYVAELDDAGRAAIASSTPTSWPPSGRSWGTGCALNRQPA